MLPNARLVSGTGWASSSTDYLVTVQVVRFDGQTGGEVLLEARWAIFKGDRKQLLQARRSSLVEPVATEDYEAMVAAMSRALGSLSREIAGALRNLPR
jgi:uncharacterized lipoprotein YmbA